MRKYTKSILALSMCLAASACDGGKKDAPAEPTKTEEAVKAGADEAGKAEAGDPAKPEDGAKPAEAASDKSPLARVMTYLDPEARAVLVLTRADKFDFDPETLGTVAGLPPGATQLLDEAHRVNDYLDPEGNGHPKWLGHEMMVVTPASGQRDYIVGRKAHDQAEMEAALGELGLSVSESEDGVRTWFSTKRFPFKVTELDGDVIAIIPAEELGSGLGPLTAGRDMPPSEMRSELEKMLSSDSAIEIALHAGGPMLHLDTSRDIAATQLGLRRDSGDAMRMQVVLAPVADPDGTAKELNERKHPEETQAVQELMKRMKFVVDKDVVVGEMTITGDDFANLE